MTVYGPTGEDFELGEPTFHELDMQVSVVLPDGRILAVWRADGQYQSDTFLIARFFDQTGEPLGDEFYVAGYGDERRMHYAPTLALLGDGSVLVSWTSGGTMISSSIFDPMAMTWGPVVQMSAEVHSYQHSTGSASLSNGDALVWWTYSEGIFGQDYNVAQFIAADGVPIGGNIDLHLFDAFHQVRWDNLIPLGDGRFFAIKYGYRVTTASEGVSGAILNADLSVAVAPFRIADGEYVYDADVTEMSDGRLFVTWRSGDYRDSDTMARILRSDGSFQGRAFQVNTEELDTHTQVAAATLANGQVLVVWTVEWAATNSTGRETLYTGLRGRFVDADGDLLGDEFWITHHEAYRTWDQWMTIGDDPVLTTTEDGRVLVTWNSHDVFLDGVINTGIVGRFFAGYEHRIGTRQNEMLTGFGGFDSLSGAGGNDTLIGLGDSDTLDGGMGADLMQGGAGNDVYFVDQSGDRAVERKSEGLDHVVSSVNYSLTGQLERLTLVDEATVGKGNVLANLIKGNELNNLLSGQGGDDTILGGNGRDTLRGGEGNDSLEGGSGLNRLDGGAGDDLLIGLGGRSRLLGGDGNDHLVIKNGQNVLEGGRGADSFVFKHSFVPVWSGGIDVGVSIISDFRARERDMIDLSDIDANENAWGNNSFVFIGKAEFTAGGQLRFEDGVLYGLLGIERFAIVLLGVSSLSADQIVL